MTLNFTQWPARLRSVATGLTARGIDVQLDIAEPIPSDELERVERYLARTSGRPDFRFHPSLRALYLATRLVRFYWKTHDLPDLPPMFGSMRLLPLSLLYESDPVPDEPESWHGVWRVLDEVGTSTQTMIRFDETGAAALAYRSIEGDTTTLTPLRLNVDDYFDLALAACARHHWPLLFAIDPTILARDHVEEMFADLEALAPPADPDLVRRHRSPG
jgi:hypothetical protein